MSTRYTFYGHGTHGIETGGVKIIVDPFFDDNPSSPLKASQVETDFIFVSHGHFDHMADAVSIAKRTNALVITNAEISKWFAAQDVKAHGQHVGGGYHHPFGYLKLTNALHGSALPDGSNGGNPSGMLLTTKDNLKIYCACDTGLFGDMQLIGDEGLDLAVLPIGDNYTMGPSDALKAVKFLRPKYVIPSHYNTWPLIEQDAEAWAKEIEAETDTKVKVLKPGESLKL